MPEGLDHEKRSMYKNNVRVPKTKDSFVRTAATLWNMLPKACKVKDFRRTEPVESAEAAEYLTEKEQHLRQKKQEAQEARKFKREIKKWITLKIPER